MVPPGATVVLSERQPSQPLASESTRNANFAQSQFSSLEGGGPRDSASYPFSLAAARW